MAENQEKTEQEQKQETNILENKEELINNAKKFHPLTFAGLGLILVFTIFCFLEGLTIRWWLMVPIAIGSGYLLYKRHQESTGLEKQVCFYGLWTMAVIFILRDIAIVHMIASFVDGFKNFLK